MGAVARKKFASQCDPEILKELKKVAEEDGKLFQSVLEDAIVEYLANHKQKQVRSDVMAHFHASVEKNRKLGELLAK